jgi:hypothetical protein
MDSTLAEQFEGFAECRLELARSAETTACRARFIQMAREYRMAMLLIHEKKEHPRRHFA